MEILRDLRTLNDSPQALMNPPEDPSLSEDFSVSLLSSPAVVVCPGDIFYKLFF